MRRTVVVVLLAIAACAPLPRQEPRDRIVRSGHPDFFFERRNDPAMQAAMRRARETLSQFEVVLGAGDPSRTRLAIKKAFTDGRRTEYVWLTEVQESVDGFEATVANLPVWLSGVHLGSRVAVRKDEVVDWMYVEDGTLVGGFTVRVLYSRESPEKRRELERSLRVTVPPP